MKTKNVLTLSTTLMIAFMALIAIGCSSNNPVSGDSANNSGTIENNRSLTRVGATVEWYGLATSVNAGTNELGISSHAELIVVAEGAEIVYKDGGNETPIDISEINVGDSLEARGDIQGDGSLLADRVRVRAPDNNNNETELKGRVESIDPAARTMTLAGFSNLINVLPTAEIVHKVSSGFDIPISLDEILVGDSVEVRGSLQTDNSLTADRVRLRDDEDIYSDLEFKSSITSIDYENGTMTVASRSETILLDMNTFIYFETDSDSVMNLSLSKVTTGGGDDDDDDDDKIKTKLSLTHLTVGDSVEVYANILDASTLYAVAIELEDGAFENQNEIEFKDFLATVDVANGIVTFDTQSWSGVVVSTTVLWGYQNETITLDMFSQGEIVEVKGFAISETEIQIVSMEKENNL